MFKWAQPFGYIAAHFLMRNCEAGIVFALIQVVFKSKLKRTSNVIQHQDEIGMNYDNQK